MITYLTGWSKPCKVIYMSITFYPTTHPSEQDEVEELYSNMHSASARTFVENILGLTWDLCGSINPTDVLIREDELVVMARVQDAIDPRHSIEGYWSFRLAEFLDVARWADLKGRDILWG